MSKKSNAIRLKIIPCNNYLLEEMEKMGMNYYEFSKYLDIHYSTLSIYMNFQYDRMSHLTTEKIASKLGIPCEYINPAWASPIIQSFKESKIVVDGKEIPCEKRSACQDIIFDDESLKLDINRCLSTLKAKEIIVIEMYFGLNGNKPMTLEEITKKMGFTKEYVQQLKENAIVRLKRSSKSKILKTYIGQETTE